MARDASMSHEDFIEAGLNVKVVVHDMIHNPEFLSKVGLVNLRLAYVPSWPARSSSV